MNKLWFLLLVFFGSCISKRDIEEPLVEQYQLKRIEMYADSTLELVDSVYPSDEYVLVWRRHNDENIGGLSIKQNDKVIWDIAIEFTGFNTTRYQNLPEVMQSPDRLKWIRTIENDTFVFLFVEDRMYLIDRSNVLGALWSDEDGEYNGVDLLGRNVFFCFEAIK